MIRHALVELNHWRTLLTKVFVKVHSIKVCSMESLCPQYRHSSSFLIPNLSSSLFVTIILCMNLKWNSLSLFSLQTVFSDLKIFDQASSFNEILLLHRVGRTSLKLSCSFSRNYIFKKLGARFKFVCIEFSTVLAQIWLECSYIIWLKNRVSVFGFSCSL